MSYAVYFQGNEVTSYIDEISADYNDLLNNWKVKIDNIQYDCYIKAKRYQDNGVGGEYNGWYYELSVHNHSEVLFEVWTKQNSITLKTYVFKDDVYSSDDFEKISLVEKTNYIDVVSDIGVSDMNILEYISQQVKSTAQYYFDRYSNVNVSFAKTSYKDLVFRLNNISGILDCFVSCSYVEVGPGLVTQEEKCCSFRILQESFFTDFFKGIIRCKKSNQCNITVKNSIPSIEGGNNQYYTKAEIDKLLAEKDFLIRSISRLPDPPGTEVIINNSSSLVLDSNQLKAFAALLISKG